MNPSSRTEPVVLAEMVDKTRALSLYYIEKLKTTDLHKTYEVEGVKLNPAFWIIAHMAVTQNGLLLRCTGAPGIKISWAKLFNMGSSVLLPADCPPLEEVLATLKEVHEHALQHIRNLAPEALDQLNPAGFEILGENTIRGMIIHFIRHEASHAGQLGWICKLNGIKTI